MADEKVSALTELTTFSGDEEFYVVEDDDGTPLSRRVTVENLAAGLAGLIGVYTAYVPTVSQNGARTTSAMTARYMQIGKHVNAWGQCTLSNAGTSGHAITVSLPVTAVSGLAQIGVGAVADTGAAWYNAIAVVPGGSTTTFGFFSTVQAAATAENFVGVTPAMALASGDKLYWNITYEAA